MLLNGGSTTGGNEVPTARYCCRKDECSISNSNPNHANLEKIHIFLADEIQGIRFRFVFGYVMTEHYRNKWWQNWRFNGNVISHDDKCFDVWKTIEI